MHWIDVANFIERGISEHTALVGVGCNCNTGGEWVVADCIKAGLPLTLQLPLLAPLLTVVGELAFISRGDEVVVDCWEEKLVMSGLTCLVAQFGRANLLFTLAESNTSSRGLALTNPLSGERYKSTHSPFVLILEHRGISLKDRWSLSYHLPWSTTSITNIRNWSRKQNVWHRHKSMPPTRH